MSSVSVFARPLVVRCGAFGDMVLLTALIRELQARFGQRVDVLTSGPWSEPLLREQSCVGEVLCVRSRKSPYWLASDQRHAVRRLRSRGSGPVWYCDGDPAARALLTRAAVATDLIVDVRDHPLRPGEHATQQWRRLAACLPLGARAWAVAAGVDLPAGDGVAAETGGCELEVSDAQRALVDDWLRGVPIIAVQMGNKRTMRRGFKRLAVNHKHWPLERWAAVVRHVRSRHPDHAIVLLGAPPEHALNRELEERAGIEGLYNAANELPVPRLVALLARARGLISVDSGPAHAAAAVGCPLVVLFGRASTSLYRPWGTPGADVEVLTGEVGGEPSMLGIGVDDVTAAWDRLRLRRSGGRQ